MPTSIPPLNELWYQLRNSIMPLVECSLAARWYDGLSLGGTRKPSDAFPGYIRPLDWRWTPGQNWPVIDDPDLQALGMGKIDELFALVSDARQRLAGTQEALKKHGHIVDKALNPGGRAWSMTLTKQLNEASYFLQFLDIGWHLMPFDFKRVQLLFESMLPLLRECISDVDTLASLEHDTGACAAGKPIAKKARPRRGTRLACIEALRKELNAEAQSRAKFVLHYQRLDKPLNLPKVLKREIARRAGYSASDLSNAFRDNAGKDLKRLFRILNDQDALLRWWSDRRRTPKI